METFALCLWRNDSNYQTPGCPDSDGMELRIQDRFPYDGGVSPDSDDGGGSTIEHFPLNPRE